MPLINSTVEQAKEVLKIEADAILHLCESIGAEFEQAVEILYRCKGKVVVTGMGKPGIISQKISATFSSTGTPSLCLHPADALHGDLGRVTKEDVLIAISNSGETEEILRLLPVLKKIGVMVIAMTGNPNSTLAKNSSCVLYSGVEKEACSLGLAPTASTTAALAMGDALAVVLVQKRDFKEPDFALYHPGGNLGKRLLLTVADVMRKGDANCVVSKDDEVKDVLLAITQARAGSASVVDENEKLLGIFTDGDLRRHIEEDEKLLARKVEEVLTLSPRTIKSNELAYEALKILRQYKIDELPVVDDENKPVGLLDVQDLLKEGLV